MMYFIRVLKEIAQDKLLPNQNKEQNVKLLLHSSNKRTHNEKQPKCLTLVVFKTNYSTLTFRKTRSRQNPTSLDICVSAISYKTSFGYRQKHNINLQLVWWFSKRHFNLVQVCDWLFWSLCHYFCRSQKHAHNCYHLTLWDWQLLVVIWTWELSGAELQQRTV